MTAGRDEVLLRIWTVSPPGLQGVVATRRNLGEGGVYRKELRPVLRLGARTSKAHQEASEPPNPPPASDKRQTER